MARDLHVYTKAWPLKEPFAIARGVREHALVIVVELREGDKIGRGEASGVAYLGETPASMLAQVEAIRAALEADCTREQLLTLLPPGGARHAIDAALWDLEAKQSGIPVWQRAGVPRWAPVRSAATIGIRSVEGYAIAARQHANFPWLKIKVAQTSPIEAVAAVRVQAPNARLIVDANQSWSVDDLLHYAPALHALRVDVIEQPVPADQDDALTSYNGLIPICADEAFSTAADLPHLAGRYQYVNIKLDKVGGLTAGLVLAQKAQAAGFQLMVGCMLGGSISVAPGMVLAQLCSICDLDGPWLQADDWPNGIAYNNGIMTLPSPQLWG